MEDPKPPPNGQEDELILSIWEGDENAKAQLIDRYVPALERSIAGRFRRLHSAEVEDVVAEAILRFWSRRDKFDPAKVRLDVCLYQTAKQVASEYTSGRLKWQKARLLERRVQESNLVCTNQPDEIEDRLDRLEAEKSPLLKAFGEEFAKLSPIEQDIWQAFADAGDFELEASQLGIEMGEKYNGGVPYTGVNIRQYKHRAKQKLLLAMKAHGFDLKRLGYTND